MRVSQVLVPILVTTITANFLINLQLWWWLSLGLTLDSYLCKAIFMHSTHYKVRNNFSFQCFFGHRLFQICFYGSDPIFYLMLCKVWEKTLRMEYQMPLFDMADKILSDIMALWEVLKTCPSTTLSPTTHLVISSISFSFFMSCCLRQWISARLAPMTSSLTNPVWLRRRSISIRNSVSTKCTSNSQLQVCMNLCGHFLVYIMMYFSIYRWLSTRLQ